MCVWLCGTKPKEGFIRFNCCAVSVACVTSPRSPVPCNHPRAPTHTPGTGYLAARLRSPWYHTGNGVASDGKSLYVIGHGVVAPGENLNNVRNSTLIQFDLVSRVVVKETQIAIEDFPESLLYSPC